MKFTGLLLTLLSLFVTVGCGPDKNVEDYRNNRIQRDLAKLESVDGRYSGVLTSKKSGAALGGFQITLGATTEVQQPGSNQTSAQPILVANVEFLAERRMAIIAKNSYYDTNNGHYQADIEIPSATQGAPATRVSISAVLKDSKMTGTVEALGFGDWGGTFELTHNGASLETIVEKLNPTAQAVATTTNFHGETTFATEGDLKNSTLQRPVELVLVRAQTTSEQEFLNLISPVKAVLVTLNYGNGARIQFQNGLWDQRNGSVTGQTAVDRTSANGPVSLLISCLSANAEKDFNCDVTTNASAQVAARLVVSTANKPVVAKDNDPSRTAVRRNYYGVATTEEGRKYKIEMTAVYGARTRLEEVLDLLLPVPEKILQISFATKSLVPISFSNARWDVQNKTMSAMQKATVSGQAYDMTLECQNFTFVSDKGRYDFTCVYGNTMRNISMNVRFKK